MRDCFKLLNKELTIGVLDFFGPEKTHQCLQSLRNHIKFDKYEIVLFVNGCQHDYPFEFYKAGLVDKLILSKANEGIALAEMRLCDFANTEYFMFSCNDNVLVRDISQEEFNEMKEALNKPNAGLINYVHVEPWSERVFMIKRDLYQDIKGFTACGCGPFRNLGDTSEMTIDKFLKNNKLEVIHWEKLNPNLIGDIGMRSYQATASNGLFLIRNDTQQLTVIQPPTRKEPESFNFTNEEWDKILSGTWIPGTIPKDKEKWVFFFYSNELDPVGECPK